MTSYITSYIPDFPYKDYVISGTCMALDFVEQVKPDHPVSRVWGEFKNKKRILDDLDKPLKLNKVVVKLQKHYDAWTDWHVKKTLELVRAGADCVKVTIDSIKVVDRYAIAFLSRLAIRAMNAVAAGISLVTSAALLGINSYEMYELSDVKVTGENALIKAISRFMTSVYGLAAAILLTIAIFIPIPFTSLITFTLFTLMYYTDIFATAWTST